MDIFLLILGFFFIILGILGSFLPVLPGPITSWIGLLILHLTKAVPMNWTFIAITFGVAFIIWLIDYFIPAMGTKRFGGTRYGVIGTMVGLILGLLFFPPFGIIIGPFIGAFAGEMLKDRNDSGRALKAAFGSFIGFLTSTFLKFIAAIVYTGLFFSIFWENREAFLAVFK
ncbi:DUF456 domain-containing protein [Lutibacter flavus]|uniref:DUF456 domain-containing protein n=1 Tax=Lutibacter flavus TaxID=691689 RepID=A0A238ZI76_9FLAO|nr:DUF456 domain-containing protein [Lutibacter flavus]SNR82404.1 hypothetical protein SAMN04488111_3287 [Lutibacter flavus]